MGQRLSLLILVTTAGTAGAQPGMVDVADRPQLDPLATTERWGGGLRLTGASGIGALPGRNLGAEVAVNVRHDELFAELAMSHWQPQNDYRVMSAGTPVELGLDLWAMRAGWSSMRMPLRAWVLAEVGEIAGTSEMSGVLSRMMTGDTPSGRRWTAVGAGVGIAWPISNQIRLLGTMELAVPLVEEHLVLDNGVGDFKPDPLAARYAIGLEVGWR
jgi:hypothetical protein